METIIKSYRVLPLEGGNIKTDNRVIFQTVVPKKAMAALSRFGDGALVLEIKKVQEKRSHRANAFLWALCDLIAKAMHVSSTWVYMDAVDHAGVHEYIIIRKKALRRFTETWSKRGMGWFCKAVDQIGEGDNAKVTLKCVYGSSSYTSKEMNDLLEYVTQEAETAGVYKEIPQSVIDELDAEMKAGDRHGR